MAIKKETTLLDSSLNTATGSTIPICKIVQVYNSGSTPLTHVANSGKIKMSKGSSTSSARVVRIIVKTASIALGACRSV